MLRAVTRYMVYVLLELYLRDGAEVCAFVLILCVRACVRACVHACVNEARLNAAQQRFQCHPDARSLVRSCGRSLRRRSQRITLLCVVLLSLSVLLRRGLCPFDIVTQLP